MRDRDFKNYSGRREEEGTTGSEGGGSERQWGMGREGRGYGEAGWAGDESRRRPRESGWYGTGEGNGGRRYSGEGYGGYGGSGYGGQQGGYGGQAGGYGGWQGGYGGGPGGYGGGQYGGSQYYGAGQYSGQGYPYQGGYGGGYWQGGGYSSGQFGYGERESRGWREGERGSREGERGWREGERGWREAERGWRGEGERGRREEEGWLGQQRRWEGERGWERGEPRGWHEGEPHWADRFWGGGEPRGPGEASHGQAGGGWEPGWHQPERRAWSERPRETGREESWGESIRSFFGIGPKGYQRSDQRISDEVCDRLTDDPRINAGDMTVNVTSGEVVLEGVVDNRFMKRLAEDVVETVSGVRNVENRLRVRREEPHWRPEQRREMTKGETFPGEGSHLISKGTEPDDIQKHQEAMQAASEAQQTGATGEQTPR